ncbi:1-acyl-sn-glycerol-3-phosphate acyltransferase [Arachnia propionica]|uniref:1-acyl-sn-glycerol-3-phosphate acyltransferase n=1 Tax=Arachnia propionica TaxID=1750 RepID=A0A3P1WWF3_9ACTN|nr:lysophospholipid acyltransferase family protein [Arachnia propionica]RRD50984.1 1-acyl-sn-glycerol-3-phosphate acyltransferase [Arachnia propionica]
MWYPFFKTFLFRPLVRYGFRARIKGAENVPAGGGAILASNHIAAMDSVVIPAMLPRKVTFPAKAELFRGDKGLGSKIVAWFLKAIGMVPMERGGGRASAASLQAITDVLAAGQVVAIYPEGTRSPDGRLYKGKTGMARMVLTSGAPVLPVGVIGTHKVKGPFGIPWVRRPIVVVGPPLDFSEYQGMQGETKLLRYVTDEVLAAIQQLTGQQYADVYATRVKHGDLKEVGPDEFLRPRPGDGVRPEVSPG